MWAERRRPVIRQMELGAEPAAVDGEFGATPLGWLHWGHDDVAKYLAGQSTATAT